MGCGAVSGRAADVREVHSISCGEVLTNEDHSAKIPVEKVARNLVFSLLGLKCASKNVKHMETLDEPQVDLFLATLIPTG